MTGGMKYDIELPNASCIIEVDKAGGWVGNNIIFLNAGIAFFVWLLSVFAVKKWLENKEAHREIADREEILRQIADNINGGVLTLVNDAGFCIRYANDGFLKLMFCNAYFGLAGFISKVTATKPQGEPSEFFTATLPVSTSSLS